MSDMYRPPQGNDPIKQNLSYANPTDLAAMKQSGPNQASMSVGQWLEMNGISIDGPMTQFVELFNKHKQMGDPLGKMQNITNSAPAQKETPSQPGGLDWLIK